MELMNWVQILAKAAYVYIGEGMNQPLPAIYGQNWGVK